MRLAIIVALAADRRSGRVLGDVLPADKAIAAVKAAITAGKCPDPSFPILVAFTLGSTLREHRFKPTAAELAECGELVPVADGDELNAALAALEASRAQINDLLAEKERMVSTYNESYSARVDELAAVRADLETLRGQAAAADTALTAAANRVAELELLVAQPPAAGPESEQAPGDAEKKKRR